MKISPYILICLLINLNRVFSQILDSENKYTVVLSDGVSVTLFGKAMSKSPEIESADEEIKSTEFYYLPCNLRLSKNKDGTPQFLFIKYTSEDQNPEKNIQGGILHLLMEYGLTDKQLKEATTKLQSKTKDAVIKGMADVTPDGENSVRVISAILTSEGRTRSLIFNGIAPTLPGSKIAVAADLDEKGAQLFAAGLEKSKSIADLSLTLSFNYTVQMPAAKGFILEDWSKLDSLGITESLEYSKENTTDQDKKRSDKKSDAIVGTILGGPIGGLIGWFSGGDDTQAITYDQMKKIHQYFEENEIIKVHFEEGVSDEKVDKVREMFFQYFLNNFTKKEPRATPIDPGTLEKAEIPELEIGDSYSFSNSFSQAISERRKKRLDLNYAMAVKRSFQLTENLASWYNGVKDNPKCISYINLNDPFFQYRDVNLILDLEAQEMMGKEMNYVTVDLRKKRHVEGSNDFSTSFTFDKKYLTDIGNKTTITYSKDREEDPSTYEYKVQYSLRGGHVFPEDTVWQVGNWGGLTLSPPIEPLLVRLEIDPDDLKINGIKNVSLQMRYKKFDKEVQSNINLSVSEKQIAKEMTIYKDKDSNGFAYRLIFYDKEKGALALPWESNINTGYVYAVIPDEIKNKDKIFLDKAIEAGKTILNVTGNSEEIQAGNQILDRFKDILIEK